jgi:hypothetical protein
MADNDPDPAVRQGAANALKEYDQWWARLRGPAETSAASRAHADGTEDDVVEQDLPPPTHAVPNSAPGESTEGRVAVAAGPQPDVAGRRWVVVATLVLAGALGAGLLTLARAYRSARAGR